MKMLRYTDGMMQVATFSVYAYFTAALFGRQFLEPRGVHKLVGTPIKFNMFLDQIHPSTINTQERTKDLKR